KTFSEDLSFDELISVEFANALAEMSYYTGEIKKVKTGFMNLGRKEVRVMESLAGKSFEEIEKLSLEGRLTEEAERVFQQMKKLRDEFDETKEKTNEIKAELDKLFTGGLEWSGMADGIIAEFQGAGSKVEEILRN